MKTKIVISFFVVAICMAAVREPYLGPEGALKIHGELELYEDISLVKIGHHLAVKGEGGHLHFIPHGEFDGETCIGDARLIHAYAYYARMVLQADNTGSWTGTTFEYTTQSLAHSLTSKTYMQTDSTAATQPVRVCVWEGTDDTGILVFDQVYPASLFIANSEIQREQYGLVEYDEGVNYFIRYSSDADFSLKLDVTNTNPWLAHDVSLLREENFLQTKAWEDGDTWAVGDYCISGRKISVCNTAGVQSGTFAANAALWDELATLADTPHNKLTSNDSYKNLLLTNNFLEYWDGTRQRIKITSTYSNIYSPDGGALSVVNAGLFYGNDRVQTEAHKGVVNGIAELDALGIVPTSQLPGYVDAIVEYASLVALIAADPQEANKIYITTDDNKMYRYTGTAGSYGEISPTIVLGSTNTTAYRGDRGVIAYDHSQLVSEHIDWTGTSDNLSTSGTVSATGGGQTGKFQTGGAGATVFSFTGGSFDVRAGSGTSSSQNTLKITSAGVFSFDDLTRIRLAGDATNTYMTGPDGTDTLLVDNTGAFYNNAEILTVGTDDVDNITSPDKNKNLTITNTTLAYHDGTNWRFISSPTGRTDYSPDGNVTLAVQDTGVFYDGVEVATVDDISAGAGWTDKIESSGGDSLIITDTSLTHNDSLVDRSIVNTVESVFYGPFAIHGLRLTAAGAYYDDVEVATLDDLHIEHDNNKLVSADTTKDLILTDNTLNYFDGTRNRSEITSVHSKLYSPDGTGQVKVDNAGVSLLGGTTIDTSLMSTGSTFLFGTTVNTTLTVNGYTDLGGGPAIKMKKLTGTTPAVEGNSVNIAHGLTGSKILAVDVLVGYSSNVNNGMPPGYIRATGYEYYSYHTSSGVVVFLSAANSERILSDTIRILITYEE